VNSLTVLDGERYVCAFGEFDRHREWSVRGAEGTGFVRRLTTGDEVLDGLTLRHHPRRLDGPWVVCNSGPGELLEVDEGSGERRRLELGRFTRGLSATDRQLLVGLSGRRANDDDRAELAVVDRGTFTEDGPRLPLPCLEVYDVVLAAAWAAPAITRGAPRSAPRRLATLDELPTDDARLTVEARLPSTTGPEDIVALDCRVTNAGTATIGSVGPLPVRVGYRWEHDGVSEEGVSRGRLPRIPGPGESSTLKLPLVTPETPDTWRLTISGVQEHVLWFDQLHPDDAFVGELEIA
jgi:hypothetical protein